MGRRGPKPTPTAILKLRGSWQAGQRGNEPKGEPGSPDCPEWLDETAKQMWETLIPQLDKMGVLSKIDGNSLTRYCQLWAQWHAAQLFIQENGDSYKTTNKFGEMMWKIYPQAAQANRLSEQLLRLEREFGLTPSSRAGIGASSAPPKDDKLEAFLKKTRAS